MEIITKSGRVMNMKNIVEIKEFILFGQDDEGNQTQEPAAIVNFEYFEQAIVYGQDALDIIAAKKA